MTEDNKTIIDYFEENVAKWGNRTYFVQPLGGGNDHLKTWTFHQVMDDVKKMAGYIESLELPPKSQIAIMSKNCAWWIIADLAIWMSGHVSVPVYPTLTAENTKYILEHSESKFLFIGKLDDHPWQEMKNGIPAGLPTVSFPLCPASDCAQKSWDDVISSAQHVKNPIKRSLDEMATIIYTSGSTGRPKGVMTSFRGLTVTTRGLCKILEVKETDRYLSYLPVAHGMERWVGECVPLYSGEELFFAESLTTFVNDLNRARPTLFLSVPRLWGKFQDGVFSKIPAERLDWLLSIPLINTLVGKMIVKGLGLDCVRLAFSGSAPIPAELITWYRKLGLELLEGYGMTENFNYSHLSQPGKSRVGYVGHPYPDVEQRIAEDGELQVKSPGMLMGYFKDEAATKETITEDGWIRTGDKGELDEECRLKVTGRTKEIFKTSKGKYVAPSPIENLLVAHHSIEMACVGGRAQPQPHAIVQLSEGLRKEAAKGESEREKIGKELEEYLTKSVNPTVNPHEHLDFIVVVKDEWLPENGLLTPTQKIKRLAIEDNYGSHVDEWYGDGKKVIWYGW